MNVTTEDLARFHDALLDTGRALDSIATAAFTLTTVTLALRSHLNEIQNREPAP